MKQTLSVYQMAGFLKLDEYAGWSYAGAQALAEYLDAEMPEDEEFDRVAIRCDFSEYPSALEVAKNSGYEAEEGQDEDQDEETALKWLREQTLVIEFTGGIIIGNF